MIHLLPLSCSLIFFCSLCSIAIDAVVLEILGAWPSHTTLSYSFLSSSFLIPWDSPPKISGLLRLMFSKFLLTSTKEPPSLLVWPFVGLLLLFLAPKHVFKCFVISDARIFLLQTWQIWSSYFFFGSDKIFSSMFLLENNGLLSLNSSLNPFLGFKSSNTIVSTS